MAQAWLSCVRSTGDTDPVVNEQTQDAGAGLSHTAAPPAQVESGNQRPARTTAQGSGYNLRRRVGLWMDVKKYTNRSRKQWVEWLEIPVSEQLGIIWKIPLLEEEFDIKNTLPDRGSYLILQGGRQEVTQACLKVQQLVDLTQRTSDNLLLEASKVAEEDRPSRVWPSGWVLKMLDIDPSLHGRILGKGGRNVGDIRRRRRVDIYVPARKEKYSTIDVLGRKEDVQMAESDIKRLIKPRKNGSTRERDGWRQASYCPHSEDEAGRQMSESEDEAGRQMSEDEAGRQMSEDEAGRQMSESEDEAGRQMSEDEAGRQMSEDEAGRQMSEATSEDEAGRQMSEATFEDEDDDYFYNNLFVYTGKGLMSQDLAGAIRSYIEARGGVVCEGVRGLTSDDVPGVGLAEVNPGKKDTRDC
ncbi:uncharacterized protein [Panulirus ornatus]|uniref:uncharacterized protein n=1 Tax=Panulirus ornatus TaxID=150431 RepID=UPI003A86483E